MSYIEINDDKINEIYDFIKGMHKENLLKYQVKLPSLKSSSGNYTKDALTLVYLTVNYPDTKVVSKEELTEFIRCYYENTNDVQQARHLGAQKGWYIASGTRNDFTVDVPKGCYKLVTLEKPYPGYTPDRRTQVIDTADWEEIKRYYNYRCATCGSVEGKPNLNWPDTITRLQKGHMNPALSLDKGNIIPQCDQCNRADRNRWIYDSRGRVIGIANANVVNTCDREIKKDIYKFLYKEFKGKSPDEI